MDDDPTETVPLHGEAPRPRDPRAENLERGAAVGGRGAGIASGLYRRAGKVERGEVPVLILGESGAGKEQCTSDIYDDGEVLFFRNCSDGHSRTCTLQP